MDLQTLCHEIFTRERMARLEIPKGISGRIINFFKPGNGYYERPGNLANWTLEKLLKESNYASWMRMKNCGPKCIDAVNRVLADIGQPQFKKPSHWM